VDNVTHSLTGFFLSHAGLNRITPSATLLLILSANAPDIDILAVAGGSLTYFHFHRHLTHSLFFAPVLAIALVALFQAVLRLTGRAALRWLPAFFVALAGIASHLLLDLTNNYGIRLLLPFSGQWFATDICAIYDLWILAFFLFCLTAPLLSKLVGGEIGSTSRRRYPSRAFPCFALVLLLMYDGGRVVLHGRALAILDARQYDDAPALRVAAFPSPSNPFRWQSVAETATSYHLYEVDILGAFDPQRGQVAFKPQTTPAIEAANTTEPFRILRDFARFPLWRAVPVDNGTEVVLVDLRYPFFAEALVNPSGKTESSFHFSR
jgi:inner membrane protein